MSSAGASTAQFVATESIWMNALRWPLYDPPMLAGVTAALYYLGGLPFGAQAVPASPMQLATAYVIAGGVIVGLKIYAYNQKK